MSCEESSRKLPDEIITIILLKLPVKSIVQCRCVCKSWLDLISTPYFAHLHLSKSPPSLLFFSRDDNCNAEVPRDFFSHDVFNDCLEIDCNYRLSPNSFDMMSLDTEFNLPTGKGAVVGSCNGLLCLSELFCENKIYICNPITGEYVEILRPKAPVGYRSAAAPIGFYYDSQSNQCKILLLLTYPMDGEHNILGQIFTLASNSWRNFHIPASSFPRHHSSARSAPLNGAIHWVASEDDNHKHNYYICSFDVAREQVRSIACPNQIKSSVMELHLVVVGNSLCLYFPIAWGLPYFEMWVMKEYGVEESWRKHIINVDEMFNPALVRPLAIKEEGSILLLEIYRGFLIYYDTRTRKSRKIEIESNPSILGAVLYTPSFVSLKDALDIGDQCLKILNVNRLKYC